MSVRRFCGRTGISSVQKYIGSQHQPSDSRSLHWWKGTALPQPSSSSPCPQTCRELSKVSTHRFSASRNCPNPICSSQVRWYKLTNQTMEEMSPDEKAKKFQRPKAQTTIDEEEINKFSALSALWWDEGGEFEALHSLNELRIPLVRDALVSMKKLDQYDQSKPLDGFWILDVGSGGGILSEPLARLGASVIGVEASEENIKIAQAHLIHDPAIRDRLKYIQATVEEVAETQAGKFDAVVASEVLEHVADANTFVTSACKLVRPGGSIFFTTLNKTRMAYALGIIAAENILRLVSPGTHDWNKFVSPMDLQYMLEKNNFSTRLVHGMWYNPLSKRWSWSKDTSINYALHAVRAPAGDGEESNVWVELDQEGRPSV